jgi:4-amino-4-deoxy-L-arabinose transferase-like glycosyltransferase
MRPTVRFKDLNAASGLLVLALLGLTFLGLNRGLWTPDEPREAEISREMWLAPTVVPALNGQAFVEKPPLYYWTVAATFALTGGASPWAARLVSALAGGATLLVLFLWGRRAYSARAGAAAAVMLATSEQFLLSTHWVLIDPLLMLSTTAAAWAAWELLAGADRTPLRLGLFAAMTAALWIKGLIGPVLLVAGWLTYLAVARPGGWRRLHPLAGIATLAAATALFVLALWWQGGRALVWEWAWVNHVQRLLHPVARTGHQQPVWYYLEALPVAVLPWLPTLLDALRPAVLRATSPAGAASIARYGVLVSAGMLVVLSAAATKREIYLLPVLPLLFLRAGGRAAERIDAARHGAPLGGWWWAQLALLFIWLLALPVVALGYLRAADPLAVTLLVLALGLSGGLLRAAWRRSGQLPGWMAAAALAASAWAWLLVPHVLEASKSMAPFVRWLNQQLPAGEPVYATDVDETLQAIVPFVSGRRVIALDTEEQPLRADVPTDRTNRPDGLPAWILVQDNRDGRAARLPADYVVVRRQAFGPGRSLTLWHRTARSDPAATLPPSPANP